MVGASLQADQEPPACRPCGQRPPLHPHHGHPAPAPPAAYLLYPDARVSRTPAPLLPGRRRPALFTRGPAPLPRLRPSNDTNPVRHQARARHRLPPARAAPALGAYLSASRGLPRGLRFRCLRRRRSDSSIAPHRLPVPGFHPQAAAALRLARKRSTKCFRPRWRAS